MVSEPYVSRFALGGAYTVPRQVMQVVVLPSRIHYRLVIVRTPNEHKLRLFMHFMQGKYLT